MRSRRINQDPVSQMLIYGDVTVRLGDRAAARMDFRGNMSQVLVDDTVIRGAVRHPLFIPGAVSMADHISCILSRFGMQMDVLDSHGIIIGLGTGGHSIFGRFTVNYRALLATRKKP